MSPLREGEETALSLIKSGPRRPLMHAWNESSSGGTAYGCARINDGACGTMYRRVSSRSRCRSFYSVTVVQWYRYRSTCLSEAGIMPLFLSRPSEKRPCARMLERPVPRHRRVSHDIHVRRSHQGEPEERAKFITISLLSPKRSRFAGFATRSAIPRMFLLEIGLFGISSTIPTMSLRISRWDSLSLSLSLSLFLGFVFARYIASKWFTWFTSVRLRGENELSLAVTWRNIFLRKKKAGCCERVDVPISTLQFSLLCRRC